MILRSAPPSPFGRKVNIAASVLGLSDRINVVTADTNSESDALREQNPLGKVPTLVLDDGQTLFDSRVILDYLDHLAGGGRIIRASRTHDLQHCGCRPCATASWMHRSCRSTRCATGRKPSVMRLAGLSGRQGSARAGRARSRAAGARLRPACRPDHACLRARISGSAVRRHVACDPSDTGGLARSVRRAGASLRTDPRRKA
jgi:glutathione S-transferase